MTFKVLFISHIFCEESGRWQKKIYYPDSICCHARTSVKVSREQCTTMFIVYVHSNYSVHIIESEIMCYSGPLTLAMVVLLTKNIKIKNAQSLNLIFAKSKTFHALLMNCNKYEGVLQDCKLYYSLS